MPGDFKGGMGVLLNEEHGEPLPVQCHDGFEDLFHHEGGEPERRFIQHQELRLAHQRPGNRQHLLFASRQRPAALADPLSKTGK